MMIFFTIFSFLLFLGAGIYGFIITRKYFSLGQEFIRLNKNAKKLKEDHLEDLKRVVKEISDFVEKSQFLQYSDEAKKLLVFLRSFSHQLIVHIQNQENEILKLDTIDEEELDDDEEEDDDTIKWI